MPVSDRRLSTGNRTARATERLATIPEEDVPEKEETHSPPPTLGYKLFSAITSPFRSATPPPAATSEPTAEAVAEAEAEAEAEAKASYGEESPPPTAKVEMDTIQWLRWICRWDIVTEKNFFNYFFTFVYGLAIISYLYPFSLNLSWPL